MVEVREILIYHDCISRWAIKWVINRVIKWENEWRKIGASTNTLMNKKKEKKLDGQQKKVKFGKGIHEIKNSVYGQEWTID